MKTAIVHDFLREYGGAERVLEAMHEVWPKAPIYTTFVDYDGLGPHAERIKKWKIITTWAQNVPFITKIYSPLRFLAPFFFRSLDLSDYDVIISSTNAYYAKGVVKRPPRGSPAGHPRGVGREPIHICYCHTPPRSLYGYPTAMDWKKNPIVRAYGTVINHFLRMYDFKAAQAVDYFIANSEEVKGRIKKFYRRDAVVIYPPVDIEKRIEDRELKVGVEGRGSKVERKKIHPQSSNFKKQSSTFNHLSSKGYFLYVGKLAYAKHVDLAILAANKLKIPLKIVGKGGEEGRLRQIAGLTVEFLGEVSDEELHKLYAQCRAFIFPAEDEDFGIVPVEAMLYGIPVIAHRSGGVVESVIDGNTGILFDDLTVDSLMEALKRFNDLNHRGMREACIRQAQKFSKERFVKEITRILADLHR